MGEQVAVVTGAGSGIGRAIALAFAKLGVRVVALGRDVQKTVDEAPTMIRGAIIDVRDSTAVDGAIADAVEHLGRISILVNCAGITGPVRPFTEWTDAEWKNVLATNLDGAFYCARAAFRAMAKQDPPGGRIVNIGSIAAHSPRPETVGYAASKAGLASLTRSISLEGRRYGISCGQIDIGNAHTGLTEAATTGLLQPDGRVVAEATFDAQIAADVVVSMCLMPPEATVVSQTLIATTMPYIGRG